MHGRSRGKKGRVRVHDSCVPPVPSFHRWLLALGLLLLATWFPYHLAAEFAESRLTRISKPSPPLPALYTLGFWFTAIGIAFEFGYACVAGYVMRQDEQEQFSDLSGRTRFRRSKKSYKYANVSLEPEAEPSASPGGVEGEGPTG